MGGRVFSLRLGSANELADRVATAITHPSLATEITASARRRVADTFGLEKTVSAVTQVILDTMGSDRPVRE